MGENLQVRQIVSKMIWSAQTKLYFVELPLDGAWSGDHATILSVLPLRFSYALLARWEIKCAPQLACERGMGWCHIKNPDC